MHVVSDHSNFSLGLFEHYLSALDLGPGFLVDNLLVDRLVFDHLLVLLLNFH